MDVEEGEDFQIMEIVGGPAPFWAGVSASGDIYLRGDIHPLGSQKALQLAQVTHIPYVPLSAVQVLFPAEWLWAECLADADRQRIIANQSDLVRSAR